MQIYTDANGVQQYTDGVISIDVDTGNPVLPVLWDVDVDGPIPDLEEVGGYSVVEGELVYSQAAFDANEALKVSVADAEAAAIIVARRADADSLIDLDGPTGVAMRSLVKAVLDELNDLRSWLSDFKVQVAAATTLANLKTGVASLPNMPNRTKAQVVAVLKNENASGNSDGA